MGVSSLGWGSFLAFLLIELRMFRMLRMFTVLTHLPDRKLGQELPYCAAVSAPGRYLRSKLLVKY